MWLASDNTPGDKNWRRSFMRSATRKPACESLGARSDSECAGSAKSTSVRRFACPGGQSRELRARRAPGHLRQTDVRPVAARGAPELRQLFPCGYRDFRARGARQTDQVFCFL